ncbi:hypothetical protein Zmor_011919 [Zophobas morio]|uniref:Cupin-like domain-containing protein n=1 Tax=Zophobas morio TaxID=2755281 RepID=A0AA38M0B6_9CUCU|nr:hypothetical protein Zmor_011919 [Zophobas morio]
MLCLIKFPNLRRILKYDNADSFKETNFLTSQIPEYCYLSHSGETEGEPIVNAWFGPGGTVSPLHQDPYHNLFAQVVGTKYLRIYDEKFSLCMYPYEANSLLSNTSRVNLEVFDAGSVRNQCMNLGTFRGTSLWSPNALGYLS